VFLLGISRKIILDRKIIITPFASPLELKEFAIEHLMTAILLIASKLCLRFQSRNCKKAIVCLVSQLRKESMLIFANEWQVRLNKN
jgi:hypothetical protein